VERGPDWKWDNQDGGPGKKGRVTRGVVDGWVKIKWDAGGENSYRYGNDGKYDIKVSSSSSPSSPSGSATVGTSPLSASAGGIVNGSRVMIRSVSVAEAETAQRGHGGYASSMASMFGKAGVVMRVDDDGDLHVRMDDGSGEKCWSPALVTLLSGFSATSGTSLILESSHPYPDDADTYRVVDIAGATSYSVTFDSQSSTERNYDFIR